MISTISVILSLILSIIIFKNQKNRNLFLCILLVAGAVANSIVNTLSVRLREGTLESAPDKIILYGTVALVIVFGTYYSIKMYRCSEIIINKDGNASERIDIKSIAVIAITSIITITFTSKSSPLYVFNDWCDPNYFLTVGRGIINGFVPYRDLYEQKGPVLYFLHAIASFIDNDGFLGIYFIEIIACFLFLFFSLKLMLLFVDKKIVLFIPLLSAIVYSSYTFDRGDSSEELCLWILVYSLYIGLRVLMKDNKLTKRHFIFVGFFGALILWTKYLMLGFYFGWIITIFLYLLLNKRIGEIFEVFSMALLGVIICSLLVFSYFIFSNTLTDLFEVYFYHNMFLYKEGGNSGITEIVRHVLSGTVKGVFTPFTTLLIIWGGITLKRIKKDYLAFYLSSLALTIIFIFFKGYFIYYSFCLNAFAPMGILFLYFFTQSNKINELNKWVKCIVAILISSIFITCSPNLGYLSETEKDMPQYQFKDIILQEESPTLVCYGIMDYGFYNVCGIVPEFKYYAIYNIMKETVKEKQLSYIQKNKPDYIVTGKEYDFSGYELLLASDYYDRVSTRSSHYYLYKRIK